MSLPEILQTPLTVPVVASPMFIASGPALVSAQCQAGVIGSFPALNARPASLLSDWLDEITESNAAYAAANPDAVVAPFAVNQIVHRSNTRMEEDLETIVEHEVPIVITSLGARPDVNEAVHSYGGIVLHDVVNDAFAHKAVERGADGLIAVAAGAGGHAGTLSPFALIQEIRTWFDGPLLLSGAIAHGRSILAALAAGADFAYVGSAFLATDEANVVDDYKDMVVTSRADDIVYSSTFTGVHGNYLRGSIEAHGFDPADLPQPEAGPNPLSGGLGEVKAWRDIWGSGQGIGSVAQRTTVAQTVDRLAAEYREARDGLLDRVGAAV